MSNFQAQRKLDLYRKFKSNLMVGVTIAATTVALIPLFAVLGYLFFQQSPSMLTREILTCIYGVTGSAVLYVNLAGYHVKALRHSLSSRGSGMFVTSLYGGAAFGGYLLGGIAARIGWLTASEIQMSLLSVVGAVLALALRPSEMSR